MRAINPSESSVLGYVCKTGIPVRIEDVARDKTGLYNVGIDRVEGKFTHSCLTVPICLVSEDSGLKPQLLVVLHCLNKRQTLDNNENAMHEDGEKKTSLDIMQERIRSVEETGLFGMLGFESADRATDTFTQDDEDRLRAFAFQASPFVRNGVRHNELVVHTHQLEHFFALAAGTDTLGLFEATSHVAETMRCTHATYFVLQKQREELWFPSADHGLGQIPLNRNSLAGMAVLMNRTVAYSESYGVPLVLNETGSGSQQGEEGREEDPEDPQEEETGWLLQDRLGGRNRNVEKLCGLSIKQALGIPVHRDGEVAECLLVPAFIVIMSIYGNYVHIW